MSARAERALALGLALLALGPLALVVIEAAASSVAPELARTIHGWLAPLCHQDAARSPVVHGHALGACWRCLGVDLGMAGVSIAARLRGRPAGRYAWTLLVVGGLDWCFAQADVVPDLAMERLVTGAALGAGLATLVLANASGVAVRLAPRRLLA